MDNSEGLIINEADNAFRVDGDQLVIRRTQEIGTLLDDIEYERQAARNRPAGDFYFFGAIPTVIVEKWMAEGFNIFDPSVSFQDIQRRVQREDAERLLNDAKRLF